MRIDTDEFIRRSKAKYGDKYDYSLVEYQEREIPVKIIIDGEDFSNTESQKALIKLFLRHIRITLLRNPYCGP